MHYRAGFEVRTELLKEVERLATSTDLIWKELTDEQNVAVRSTVLPNNSVCLSAHGTIQASPQSLYEAIMRVRQQIHWDIFLGMIYYLTD